MRRIGQIQLGKQGVTDNFISTLRSYFKDMEVVKVHVLKSARGEGKDGKEIVKKYAKEVADKLGLNFKPRVIGFVIVIKKYRKPIRAE